ncbi:hypothetical protein [Fusobacterium necrophorum]|uniref:Uncharacterized protein n=1 Tax=Fusobacterium necrophorum DJ-2 TaxID=1441737 RepID=A0AB73C1Q7_9FUSO|nr:hypothetical protein [Fusobacterium necrophorum]KDE64822.1 hypothetical protein FUSO4_07330 [Fusobacterium necrophorum DJ-1]KDE70849.1 hypothetical protein FUSO8_08700 [Fusobacterium necrophorum DJ-2]MBR8821807.1 hypothetical protein [Fusobacterium necrophorum]MCF0161863.1 hypothetical protein [Fusobacterium necrophorum]
MAKRKNKINVGDIFSMKVSKNEFIYGRVLFDVTKQYIKTPFENNYNYLSFFNKCFLIETFLGVSASFENVDMKRKAVISTFVPDFFFSEYEANIIDNIEVDVKEVSFPETLSSADKRYFSVGELYLPIDLSDDECYKIKIYPSFGSGFQAITATLDYSGRTDLIEEGDRQKAYFKYSDLRNNPKLRREIYDMIGEDPNQSYYELALKHGFDLARLYEH